MSSTPEATSSLNLSGHASSSGEFTPVTADRTPAGASARTLARKLRDQEARREQEAVDAFKFEQILRSCVAQQAQTIEELNLQITQMKRDHDAAVRGLERRCQELEARTRELEELRATTQQFIESYQTYEFRQMRQ